MAQASQVRVVGIEVVVEVNLLLVVEGEVNVGPALAVFLYVIYEARLVEGSLASVLFVDVRLAPQPAEGESDVVLAIEADACRVPADDANVCAERTEGAAHADVAGCADDVA